MGSLAIVKQNKGAKMKKLIIAVAIASAAVASQAASFDWGSANYSTMANRSGSEFGTDTTGYTTFLNGGNIVLVLLKDGTYTGEKSVLTGTSGSTAELFTGTPASKTGTLQTTFAFSYESGILKNGDVLGVMFKDASGSLSQLEYIAGGKIDNV